MIQWNLQTKNPLLQAIRQLKKGTLLTSGRVKL